MIFTPDSKLLTMGSSDRTIRLWEVVTREEHCKLTIASPWALFATAWDVIFLLDDKLLAPGPSHKVPRYLGSSALGTRGLSMEGKRDLIFDNPHL
jgi:WD40 repeat protein